MKKRKANGNIGFIECALENCGKPGHYHQEEKVFDEIAGVYPHAQEEEKYPVVDLPDPSVYPLRAEEDSSYEVPSALQIEPIEIHSEVEEDDDFLIAPIGDLTEPSAEGSEYEDIDLSDEIPLLDRNRRPPVTRRQRVAMFFERHFRRGYRADLQRMETALVPLCHAETGTRLVESGPNGDLPEPSLTGPSQDEKHIAAPIEANLVVQRIGWLPRMFKRHRYRRSYARGFFWFLQCFTHIEETEGDYHMPVQIDAALLDRLRRDVEILRRKPLTATGELQPAFESFALSRASAIVGPQANDEMVRQTVRYFVQRTEQNERVLNATRSTKSGKTPGF